MGAGTLTAGPEKIVRLPQWRRLCSGRGRVRADTHPLRQKKPGGGSTPAARPMILNIMPKPSNRASTMTELLRQALTEAESVRAVAKATGVQQASLVRFLKGQQSLRLDMADKLAAYFGIECRRFDQRG